MENLEENSIFKIFNKIDSQYLEKIFGRKDFQDGRYVCEKGAHNIYVCILSKDRQKNIVLEYLKESGNKFKELHKYEIGFWMPFFIGVNSHGEISGTFFNGSKKSRHLRTLNATMKEGGLFDCKYSFEGDVVKKIPEEKREITPVGPWDLPRFGTPLSWD